MSSVDSIKLSVNETSQQQNVIYPNVAHPNVTYQNVDYPNDTYPNGTKQENSEVKIDAGQNSSSHNVANENAANKNVVKDDVDEMKSRSKRQIYGDDFVGGLRGGRGGRYVEELAARIRELHREAVTILFPTLVLVYNPIFIFLIFW